MAHYKLYFFVGGHIVRAQDLECDGDLDALKVAEAQQSDCDIEVWQRDRKVTRVRAKEEKRFA